MIDHEQERMQQLLKLTMQPISGQTSELRHDLWPATLRRLEARPARVPWFDWALLAAVAVWLLFFPGAIPWIFYYL
jgi:hypothetical protein